MFELHVAPEYDREVEADIQEWFEEYYSIGRRNYPVDEGYLGDSELVPLAAGQDSRAIWPTHLGSVLGCQTSDMPSTN